MKTDDYLNLLVFNTPLPAQPKIDIPTVIMDDTAVVTLPDPDPYKDYTDSDDYSWVV